MAKLPPDTKGRARSLRSDGYIHVKVGLSHPMAHVNGWAREHRVMMSEHLGRPLLPNEEVHHRNNETKADNRISNFDLELKAEHTRKHNHRLGTAKGICKKGHQKILLPSGKYKRCRVCENHADRSRYNHGKH